MSKKNNEVKIDNVEIVDSQSPDQQELLVLEDNYKSISVINYHVENIIDELKDLTSHFFKLGYHLFKLKESWNDVLAKSEFYKFCEEKFLLKSTSIKNFINVYKSFRSIDDEDEIDERFVGFSFTALVELLPISDDKEFAKNFKQLSTREIKKVVSLIDENNSDLGFFMKVFDLFKALLLKKNVNCKSIEIDENCDYPSGEFEISLSNVNILMDFDLRKGVDYYGDKEDEVFYLRTSEWINDFDFWSETFGIDSISKVADKLTDAIIKFAEIKADAVDDKPSNRVEYIPTGCAKRMNLKKKDLIPYVDNPENYCEDIDIHIVGSDSLFCDFQIRCLRCNDYIWAIFKKPSENDYDYDDLSDEEKNSYRMFKIINSNFNELNKYDKEELMLKE